MKQFNRAIGILLCLVMAFSCFGLIALAEDPEEPHVHEYRSEVVNPTCVDRGYTLHVCSGCGDYYKTDYTDPIGHSYGQWTEVRAATCTAEGLQERECVRCHGKETKTIPVLPHVDEDENGECDNCGAKMEVKHIFSPFEWLKSFIAFIKNLVQGIFA